MEEADDITGTEGNSLGMVPPGMENDDNREASEESGAIGEREPEQSTGTQVAMANELKRLGARNPPGIEEGSGLARGARRKESTLLSAKTRYDVLSQQFRESLEDLGRDYAAGKGTRGQLRATYRELKVSGDRLSDVAEELKRAQEKIGAVEEVQGVHGQMLQFEARMGSLRQQLGPGITEEGGSVRSGNAS